MRSGIWRNTRLSILTANILFPIVLLFNAFLLLMTRCQGHSPEIADELNQQAKLRALAATVKGDGTDLDEAKLALLRGDRALAFELATKASALVDEERVSETTNLIRDIFEHRI
jgi:hypothetical protein